ncbi:LuxR C-terminal-related transcriptional regulator [Streptosporangium sp. NBC_01495]|uniref:helix-turn-helix transcriptional regulator n=1 Tax=Streptosporangium sp. NBC_01495 TaxID=2903899 RepID=UPI002E2F6B34|nr:LuxR C-terminal-related transcriptional regulator [Streptosporangium sp. NBC_01495]
MADALDGPLPVPRSLPAGEPMAVADYRRLVGVLEAVDRTADLRVFQERLVRALRSWFGYAGIAVLHGGTLREAIESGCGVQGGYSPRFLADYTARWVDADPFRTERARRLLTAADVVTLDEVAPDREYAERFLRSYGITGKVATMIDGGPAGVLYVGMAMRDTPHVPARDRAVLRALRRHLTPLAVEQLTRHREQMASRADWRLTPREWEVARLAAQGLTNRGIADHLFVGVDTVKKHLSRVLDETGCASHVELAARWRQWEHPSGARNGTATADIYSG